jgi:hypothetical protein
VESVKKESSEIKVIVMDLIPVQADVVEFVRGFPASSLRTQRLRILWEREVIELIAEGLSNKEIVNGSTLPPLDHPH